MSTKSQPRPFLAIALLVFAVNFISMPREAYIGDPMAIRLGSLHLVLLGKVGIDVSEKKALGAMTDSEGQYFYLNAASHTYYPKWGFLNTLLFTPPLIVENALHGIDDFFTNQKPQDEILLYNKSLIFWLNIYNIALSLGLAFYLFKLARLYTVRIATSYVFILLSFYATFLWNYLRAPSSEIFQLLFFAACTFHFISFQRNAGAKDGLRHLLVAAICAGLLMLTKPYYVLLFPIIAGFALRQCRDWRRIALPILIPAGASLALLMLVQWHQFGSPFETGYGQWKANGRNHDFMAISNLPAALRGFLLSGDLGIFAHFPILILALPAMPLFWKRHRQEWLFVVTVFFVFLLFISCFSNWSGQFCYGPRYLLFVLPALSLPLIALIDKIFEEPRKPAMALAAAVLITVAGFSAALQHRVNTLPFCAMLYLDNTYSQLKIPEATRYFQNRNLGVVSGEFIAYVKDDRPFPPMEAIRKGLPPKSKLIGQFEEYQHSTTFAPNYFFAY